MIVAEVNRVELLKAEFYKHDTIYKTNDHMTFSWWGYNAPTQEDLKASESEGWWGAEIPYVPAE